MSKITYTREQQPLTVEISGGPQSGKTSVARLIATALHNSGMEVLLASRDDLPAYTTAEGNMENVPVFVTDSLYEGRLFDGGHWNWEHGSHTAISGSPQVEPIQNRGDFWTKVEETISAIALLAATATDDTIETLVNNQLAELATDRFSQYRHPVVEIERKGKAMHKVTIKVYGLYSSEPFEREYILYSQTHIVCRMRNPRDQEAYMETAVVAEDDMARHQADLVAPPVVSPDDYINVIDVVQRALRTAINTLPISSKENDVERHLDADAIKHFIDFELYLANLKKVVGEVGVKVEALTVKARITFVSGEEQTKEVVRPDSLELGTIQRISALMKVIYPGIVAVHEAAKRGEGAFPAKTMSQALDNVKSSEIGLVLRDLGMAVSFSADVPNANGWREKILMIFDPTSHTLEQAQYLRDMADQLNLKEGEERIFGAQNVSIEVLDGHLHPLVKKLAGNIASYVSAIHASGMANEEAALPVVLAACQNELRDKLHSFDIPQPVVLLFAEEGHLKANVTIGATQARLSAPMTFVDSDSLAAYSRFHNEVKPTLDRLTQAMETSEIKSDRELVLAYDVARGTLSKNGINAQAIEGILCLFRDNGEQLPVARFFAGPVSEDYQKEATKVDEPQFTHVGDNFPRSKKLTAAHLRKVCRIKRGVGSEITPPPSAWPKVRNFVVGTDDNQMFKVRLRATNDAEVTAEAKPVKKAVKKTAKKK